MKKKEKGKRKQKFLLPYLRAALHVVLSLCSWARHRPQLRPQLLQAMPRSIVMNAGIVVVIKALTPWVLQAVGSLSSSLAKGDPRPLSCGALRLLAPRKRIVTRSLGVSSKEKRGGDEKESDKRKG